MAKVGKAIKNGDAMCMCNIRQFPAPKALETYNQDQLNTQGAKQTATSSSTCPPATAQLPP